MRDIFSAAYEVSVTLFSPGLTYDEVISFVPPPLDQEEMES